MLHKTSDCFESIDLTTMYNSSTAAHTIHVIDLDIVMREHTTAGYFRQFLAPRSDPNLILGAIRRQLFHHRGAGRKNVVEFQGEKEGRTCYLPKILPAVYSVHSVVRGSWMYKRTAARQLLCKHCHSVISILTYLDTDRALGDPILHTCMFG